VLDAGADDYLVKPFGVGQIEARVRAVLRRAATDEVRRSDPVVVGGLRLDGEAHETTLDSRPLLAMAVIVADQLARTLVRPLGDVAMAAERLASGDLTARAPLDGPPEVQQVSNGLNPLAARIGELRAHERETLADLSHRLRTPLTALRSDAEALSADPEVMTRVISDVDALSRTVNEIIAEARRRPAACQRPVTPPPSCVRGRPTGRAVRRSGARDERGASGRRPGRPGGRAGSRRLRGHLAGERLRPHP